MLRNPAAPVRNGATILAWTVLAFALLGYHPYAEDGGIYTAAVAGAQAPSLYPVDHAWVTAHTRYGLFVPLTAGLGRAAHTSPEWTLLALQLAGLAALLAAAMHLARTMLPGGPAWPAACAMALGAGLPVAGTALYAVDPYCTARSVASPLLLFALSFGLRGRWTVAGLCWSAAAALHPVMALWGGLVLLAIAAVSAARRVRWAVALLGVSVLAGGLAVLLASPDLGAAREAALTRAYWFPARWEWFEWPGIAGPLLLLGLAAGRMHSRDAALRRLFLACSLAAVVGVALACCFARITSASFVVARLQPLRVSHLIFLAFLATAGGVLAGPFEKARKGRWPSALFLPCLCLAGLCVMWMQRGLYAHTPHVEWPWSKPVNHWEQAFYWCRDHTPRDALFALDARYIDLPGEDSHGFRAAARRSTLPDGVKDAGVVAVLPQLAAAWKEGSRATQGLNHATDAQRRERLLPFGVIWIVLPAGAETAFLCPYRNTEVKVCRLAESMEQLAVPAR